MRHKTYVTFGQCHVHRVNGKTFDCDSVAVIESKGPREGRGKAFELFGDKFFTTYSEEFWDESNLEWFPRGLINVEG